MKSKIALVAAVVLGIVAAFGVRSYLKREVRRVDKKLQPMKILVYKKRLPKGAVLLPSMLAKREVPKEAVTTDSALLRDRVRVFNRRLIADVERNQPVQWKDFEEVDVSLKATLRPGERAVTLSVDNVTGVAGNIRPGSHVDVFGTFQLVKQTAARGARSSGLSKSYTKTALLLSNVLVIAIDNRTTLTQYSMAARRAGATYSTITVAVTPSEAIMLIYAQESGKVSLALRYPTDPQSVEKITDISQETLFQVASELERQRRIRQAPKKRRADEDE